MALELGSEKAFDRFLYAVDRFWEEDSVVGFKEVLRKFIQ